VTTTRLMTPDDAPALAALLRANREFLAPWDPIRPEDYYTDDGQRAVIAGALAAHAAGRSMPHLILDAGGEIAGRVNLSTIVRGAFQSCSLGYWVAAEQNGRGLATAAVAEMMRLAFEVLQLHRIEAGTLVHNVRSQRVLEHNGFTRFGLAPSYLFIAGRWQDHAMYQALSPLEVTGA
jgi:ribosomal-protein-alanine N-acetyltransferase